jgi:hypothetical protein
LSSASRITADADDEAVFARHLAQALVPAGFAAVARFEINVQQQRLVAAIHEAQLRHPLRRLVVLHLTVPQAGGHEHRGISLRADVVVRRVRQHVFVVVAVVRIAPLLVFERRERNRIVEHGRDDVHERYVGDEPAILLRRDVRDDTDQQAACAAAGGEDTLARAITARNEEVGNVDEIIERVPLAPETTGFVPAAAALLSAAHVRDGVDEAAVQQRQPRRAECRIRAQPVRAIRVLIQRSGSIDGPVLAIHDRDRHELAVACGRPQEFAGVARGIEIAEHRLALAQMTLAAQHIVVVGRAGRRQRGVHIAQQRRFQLRVRAELHGVRRVVRREIEALAAPALHPDAQQPARALVHGEKIAEHVHRLHEHIGVVRHDVAPRRAVAAPLERRDDDAEIFRLPVGADQHAIVEIFDLVFVVRGARDDDCESQRRIAGARIAPLGARRALRADVQVPIRLAAHHDEIEALVRLFVHEPVGARRSAEHVRAYPPPEQSDRILLDVQQRAIVVGPRHIRLRVLDHVAEQRAAGNIFEADPELAASDDIFRVREQRVVGARFIAAELKKRLPRRERVAIEQHHFLPPFLASRRVPVQRERAGVGTRQPPHDHRILAPGNKPPAIPIPAVAHRHRRIILLDAADDLAIQPLDQRLHRTQNFFGIGCLGPQMTQHLRVAARVVAQPIERVLPYPVGRGHTVHAHGGRRGMRHGKLRHGSLPENGRANCLARI